MAATVISPKGGITALKPIALSETSWFQKVCGVFGCTISAFIVFICCPPFVDLFRYQEPSCVIPLDHPAIKYILLFILSIKKAK